MNMFFLTLIAWQGGWSCCGENIIEACRTPRFYFADNGAMMPTHDLINPPALYDNGKTYIVWQTLDPYITSYNHITERWSDTIKVGDSPLAMDSHGSPAILIDTLGYFHVFYGCHNSVIKHAKSNNPNDISAWTMQADVGGASCTYPQPVKNNNGHIYVFYRTLEASEGEEVYVKSIDNGSTWAGAIHIVNFGVGFSTGYGNIKYEYGTPEKIHYTWCVKSGVPRLNVYHAYLNLADNNMYSMDGTNMGVTISKVEADANCLVLNSGANETNIPSVQICGGIPYIIFIHDDTGWKFKFTKWNGVGWDAPITITSTDNLYNSHDFIVHASDSMEAYLVTSGEVGRGGDIEKWDWNGVSWNKDLTILREGDKTICNTWRALGNPWVVKDYSNDLKIVFSEGTWTVYTTGLKVFTWGNNGFIGK